MAKQKAKQKYYVVFSPEFQGIVRTLKEYNKYIVKKKDAFGKSFDTKEKAQAFFQEVKQNGGKRKTTKGKYYAIHGPLFTGVTDSKSDYDRYVFGQKGMCGKHVHSIEEGEAWIRKYSKQRGKKSSPVVSVSEDSLFIDSASATFVEVIEEKGTQGKNEITNQKPHVLPTIEQNMLKQCVLYIDGGFKDGIGKYGLLAYASTSEQPILKDFGYVYDDSFNALMNTGAELMACLRGLEWAYANDMNKIVIVYDYVGIIRMQKSMSEQRAVQVFTKMMARFQQLMDVQFIHVRHSNRELHNAVHALTQIVV